MTSKLDFEKLNPEEMRSWLVRALNNQASLSCRSGEYPNSGIELLQRKFSAEAQKKLREATLSLVKDFCESAIPPPHARELLSLVQVLDIKDAIPLLVEFVRSKNFVPPSNKEDFSDLDTLATLVVITPHQPVEFWMTVFKMNPRRYGSLVVSGILATDPVAIFRILHSLQEVFASNERLFWLAFSLKIDLLDESKKPEFVGRLSQFLRDNPSMGTPEFRSGVHDLAS